jgi:hypothetical protein
VALQGFERKLERLVERSFGRAFRSAVQPVELGRRMLREVEAGRQIGVRGTVAPNRFEILLAAEDFEQFEPFADVLARELADTVRDHARAEQYHFVGPVVALLAEAPERRRGDFAVNAQIVQGSEGWHAAIAMPDGQRIALTSDTSNIGRLPDCTIHLSDPQSSRYHAEIRAGHDGFRVVDLKSTNGTYVNGTAISEQLLRDGDEIRIGSTAMRFEES